MWKFGFRFSVFAISIPRLRAHAGAMAAVNIVTRGSRVCVSLYNLGRDCRAHPNSGVSSIFPHKSKILVCFPMHNDEAATLTTMVVDHNSDGMA